MLVSQILSSKADIAVVSIGPETAVAEAVKLLSDKRIGAVIVSFDGTGADGILSERDIVRELGRRGPECLADTAGKMMTRNPVSCTGQDSAVFVLETMTEGRFRHMPVVEDGKMIGLISIGDVVKSRLAELSMEKEALEGMIMGH